MVNIWKRGPISSSPYVETAFKTLGIDRNTISPVEIRRRIEDRRRAVDRVPGMFKLGDSDLTQTHITRAAEVLTDPNRRILEELLEHNPEKPQVREIERLKKHLAATRWPDQIPQSLKGDFLIPIVRDIALLYLKNLPSPDKSFAGLLQKQPHGVGTLMLPEGPPGASKIKHKQKGE